MSTEQDTEIPPAVLQEDMTLRDYFAAAALPTLVESGLTAIANAFQRQDPKSAAKQLNELAPASAKGAYHIAEGMMKHRRKLEAAEKLPSVRRELEETKATLADAEATEWRNYEFGHDYYSGRIADLTRQVARLEEVAK